jgi:NDP-hexose-3-ketoreductase
MFHPQVAAIQELLGDADRASMRVTAVFSVPPLPAADFRYRADCGGGCLSDLGPYAVSINRVLIGRAPSSVSCRVLTRSPEVDTSFSALMTHDSGAAVAAHCGFVTAYQNRLSVLTAARAVDVDRIFTTPSDAPNTIRIREASGDRALEAPAADAFAGFLGAFAEAVARGDTGAFEAAMVEDAELLERLRHAAADGPEGPPPRTATGTD